MSVDAEQDRSFESWLGSRRVRFAVVLIVSATLLATLYLTQDYRQFAAGAAIGPPIEKVARQRLVIWYLWALLTPAIIVIGSRIRASSFQPIARIALWIALGLVTGVVHSSIFVALTENIPWLAITKPASSLVAAMWERAGLSYAGNITLFALIALGYHVAAYAYDARRRDQLSQQLAARLARSELEVLKMQLQPHFMFNTLQTASALMQYDVEEARRVLATLGSVLRFSLDTLGTQEIPLRDEINVLNQYVGIQSARFKDRLRFTLHVDASVERVLVPGLLLQPLVENAIRHGVEPRARGGVVDVTISRVSDRLFITVEDDGPGLAPGSSDSNGVGLRNVRGRLQHLYGDAATLALMQRPAGGCRLELTIPAREGSA